MSSLCMGMTDGVRFAAGARYSSLLHSAQTDSESHRASYLMGNGNSFYADKWAGA
jgi:hypothetical protein